MFRRVAILVGLGCFVCCTGRLSAQGFAPLPATRADYIFPLPSSNGLTGTFMELRGTHFHYGIDIRTWERTGLPVVAAADGYISRVRLSHSGYGKAIFIQHPDSNSTCYGHVERLMPAVEVYLYALQTKNKQFDIEVFPKPEQFPVKKGDTIAWSGNTGASAGPHLHYEVRNKKEEIMNPLAWHKGQVKDELAPVLYAVALEPIAGGSRVNGKFEKQVLRPERSENLYYTKEVVSIAGPVGVEFNGYDRLNGARNWNGVYCAELYLDDTLVFEWKMQRFAFDETRYITQFIDYAYWMRTGSRLQKCYIDAGNNLRVYPRSKNRGLIELRDTLLHRLRLEVSDFHGNAASFTCRVRRGAGHDAVVYGNGGSDKPSLGFQRGHYVVRQPNAKDSTAGRVTLTYADGSTRSYAPTYSADGYTYTLVPINPITPPVRANAPGWASPIELNYKTIVMPEGGSMLTDSSGLRADFGAGNVFIPTPVPLTLLNYKPPQAYSPLYTLGDPHEPVLRPFKLTLTTATLPKGIRPEQLLLAEVRGDLTNPKKLSFARAGFDYRIGRSYSTHVSSFGTYALVADVTPPVLLPQNFKAGQPLPADVKTLFFTLTDDIAGVQPYKIQATLDGQWVLAEYYNYRGELYITLVGPLLKPLAAGRHVLKVSVSDYAGNTVEREYGVVVR